MNDIDTKAFVGDYPRRSNTVDCRDGMYYGVDILRGEL